MGILDVNLGVGIKLRPLFKIEISGAPKFIPLKFTTVSPSWLGCGIASAESSLNSQKCFSRFFRRSAGSSGGVGRGQLQNRLRLFGE